MKHQAKLVLFGFLSLTIGVAFASPLLAAELNIKPFIRHVQGPTADFSVNTVYANFTIVDGDEPVSYFDGPAIEYFVVLNVTNLSDLGAVLNDVNFVAAEKITNATESAFWLNGISGSGYEVEGAWVDGVWYNVTYVSGAYPTIDKDGNIIEESSFLNSSWFTPYWMAGIQVLDTYANGTLIATYMNMNGTWTNVTGKINFTRPKGVMPFGGAVSINNTVVNELHVFQTPLKSTHNLEESGTRMEYTWIGEGLFDNYWAPHQSRLIVLQGTRDIKKPWASTETLDALKSGSVTLQTQVFNHVNVTIEIVNGTIADTWSYATELKQVRLTRNGDSFIYNTILGKNQLFAVDQYGVEVFIETRP